MQDGDGAPAEAKKEVKERMRLERSDPCGIQQGVSSGSIQVLEPPKVPPGQF